MSNESDYVCGGNKTLEQKLVMKFKTFSCNCNTVSMFLISCDGGHTIHTILESAVDQCLVPFRKNYDLDVFP